MSLLILLYFLRQRLTTQFTPAILFQLLVCLNYLPTSIFLGQKLLFIVIIFCGLLLLVIIRDIVIVALLWDIFILIADVFF